MRREPPQKHDASDSGVETRSGGAWSARRVRRPRLRPDEGERDVPSCARATRGQASRRADCTVAARSLKESEADARRAEQARGDRRARVRSRRMLSLPTLHRACPAASRGKRGSPGVAAFVLDGARAGLARPREARRHPCALRARARPAGARSPTESPALGRVRYLRGGVAAARSAWSAREARATPTKPALPAWPLSYTARMSSRKAGMAPTDLDWFEQLSTGPAYSEINFWTPTPWNLRQLHDGDRFFFMLKEPVRKIGGYGSFVRYENHTAVEAWSLFGRANGVGSLQELAVRCSGYARRNAKEYAPSDDPVIGCIVLRDAVFLPQDRFVDPADFGVEFAPQVVKAKYFDANLLADVVASRNAQPDAPFQLVTATTKSYADGRRVKRAGQPKFRRDVLRAYGYRCCISGESERAALQGAHIQPYVNEASHHVQNGLPLRLDLHALFDDGLLAIDENRRVMVSCRVNSADYKRHAGQQLRPPLDPRDGPSVEALTLQRASFRDKV